VVSAISGVFLMYGFYSWQPYILALLGKNNVWLLGVVQAASSAAGILGSALVGTIMRTGARRRDPSRVLAAATLGNAALVAAIGLVGLVWREAGVMPATIAIVLWLAWGVIFGVSMPVRMSFLNEHIPSSERATVLSLDAFFSDAGGAVGQPAFGWLSDRASVSVAWLVGSVLVGIAAPLYRRAGDAANRSVGAGAGR
jgi:MFS family permease